MVRKGAGISDELVPVRRPYKAIEQAVSVNVAAFLPGAEKANSTKTMNASPHSGPSRHRRFDLAYRAEAARTKQTGDREEQRIEELR